jgi:hypothetical protein
VHEEQHLFVGRAGEGVAGGDLQEVEQVAVAAGGFVEHLLPKPGAGRGVVVHGAQAGDQVFAAVRAQLAGPTPLFM